MRKQKWMMMGITAVVCSAMFVPGAFAKDKDDSYSVTSSIFAPGPYSAPVVQKTDAVTGTQTAGSAFTFAPIVNEKEEN
ncbi:MULTISPECIES: hypothetical protein [Brevibacillus]|uniref:Uncharacterized protein n=1 Tax=Brevibacillus porteri TaxID=2126350 RepID=A0ABX5FXP7_9BACL|nr:MULTISPECIES: hypothetical protein [Brevibacillus]MDC0763593.1 hypothetical protein [Brevibacillus sp. AG]MED1800925.1 hypothetical protein [Brevibacillus porteri]MED2130311.1 hypothetical protein [Brevibacillus porteri]MED2742846.1 hypothetical protein [Brevibacillus porteri]MED2817274.1 hypothetical protein [Brevibacillus porteri]